MSNPKTKKVKCFIVVWTEKAAQEYGVRKTDIQVISLSDEEHNIVMNINKRKIGRPKMRPVELLPFFITEEEAEAYRNYNPDFQVLPATLTYPTQ